MSELTIWKRLSEARKSMRLNKTGNMRLGGNKIDYATIDDLYSSINKELTKHDLWLNTPLDENRVHIRVIDVNTGESIELLSYPCVLTGRDVKADAGMWTSCKRYALTSAFNLAAGDESGAEDDAVKQEERRATGYVRQQRYRGVPESKITGIRALLVQSGVTDPNGQRERIVSIINHPISRLNEITPAEADRILEVITPPNGNQPVDMNEIKEK
jgi:hypothetical protein